MIIVMQPGASREQVEHVFEQVRTLGYQVHPIYGEQRTVIACVGDERGKSRLQALDVLDGVESVVPILKPYKLASTDWKPGRTVIRLGKAG
jgi:3-deoxy-7-phosphoheptulonate synthase